MSRSVLLASCLFVPLLACADDPAPYQAPFVSVSGAGVDEEGIWYLPGRAETLEIATDDDAETSPADWRYEASGQVRVTGDVGPGPTPLWAWVPLAAADTLGEGSVTVRDVGGEEIRTLSAHVVHPDELWLIGNVGGAQHGFGSDVRVLAGNVAELAVAYSYQGHVVAGAALLEAPAPAAVFQGDGNTNLLRLPASSEPYVVRLLAGPDAIRDVDVRTIPAAGAVLALNAGETGHVAGDSIGMRFSLLDREGNPLLYSRDTWTQDGFTILPIYGYTYDPAEPAVRVEVTIATEGTPLVASVMIHKKR